MIKDPFDHIQYRKHQARVTMKDANDILELCYGQQLAWFMNKHKLIRWRVISHDDPFWGQFHEWGARPITKSGKGKGWQ